tara:strand:- start:2092 stop:2721 length:630 start_codon:yes stop_codon:yes gene_type:complete
MISINIEESDRQIYKKVNQAMADHINEKVRSKSRALISKLKTVISVWVKTQPEIVSLLQEGVPQSLNAQFGLPPGSANKAVDQIVNAVVDSTQVKISKVDRKLSGTIEFNFQPSTFANLLSLSSGVNTTEEGSKLNWLSWLLVEGDKIIIVGYRYQPSEKGRAGGGNMVRGGAFRVSPQFSGTLDNNFITRAFRGRNSEITRLISGIFK